MLTTTKASRGVERERNLEKSVYFSDAYFRLHQLCSFAHQIHDIHQLKPKSIIEVGIGNGFTSTFLKSAGFDVFTVDINPNLSPDLCAPISELPNQLRERKFDLVVCCEVLEHLPFDEFESCMQIFQQIASRMYLTLPQAKKFFGFGGFLQLPKLGRRNVNAYLSRAKALPAEHYWEVGSAGQTSKLQLSKIIAKYFETVEARHYCLNPYHICFSAANT